MRIAERQYPNLKSDQTVETLTTASTASLSSDEIRASSHSKQRSTEQKERSRFSISSPRKADATDPSSKVNPKKDRAVSSKKSKPSLSGFLNEDRKTSKRVRNSSRTVAPRVTQPETPKVRKARSRSITHGGNDLSDPATPVSPSKLQDIFSAYDDILKAFDGSARFDETGW
jgi:hypothetical protein